MLWQQYKGKIIGIVVTAFLAIIGQITTNIFSEIYNVLAMGAIVFSPESKNDEAIVKESVYITVTNINHSDTTIHASLNQKYRIPQGLLELSLSRRKQNGTYQLIDPMEYNYLKDSNQISQYYLHWWETAKIKFLYKPKGKLLLSLTGGDTYENLKLKIYRDKKIIIDTTVHFDPIPLSSGSYYVEIWNNTYKISGKNIMINAHEEQRFTASFCTVTGEIPKYSVRTQGYFIEIEGIRVQVGSDRKFAIQMLPLKEIYGYTLYTPRGIKKGTIDNLGMKSSFYRKLVL